MKRVFDFLAARANAERTVNAEAVLSAQPAAVAPTEQSIINVTPGGFGDLMEKNPTAMVVDVRGEGEYRRGYIPGAVLMPLDRLQHMADQTIPDKTTPCFVYCHSGARSQAAVGLLSQMGYTNLVNMSGGIMAWAQEGRPLSQ